MFAFSSAFRAGTLTWIIDIAQVAFHFALSTWFASLVIAAMPWLFVTRLRFIVVVLIDVARVLLRILTVDW